MNEYEQSIYAEIMQLRNANERFRAENEKLDDIRIDYICKINKLVDERAKLMKALLYVYDNSLGLDPDKITDDIEWVTAEIRAARAALELEK